VFFVDVCRIRIVSVNSLAGDGARSGSLTGELRAVIRRTARDSLQGKDSSFGRFAFGTTSALQRELL
jgi:hypothetical protein